MIDIDDQEEDRKRYSDKIINSPAKKKIIVAGAGTGKTFTFKGKEEYKRYKETVEWSFGNIKHNPILRIGIVSEMLIALYSYRFPACAFSEVYARLLWHCPAYNTHIHLILQPLQLRFANSGIERKE